MCSSLSVVCLEKTLDMNIEPEAAAAAGKRRLNHIFFFSLNCSLLMQVFPPKVELVFPLAVPLIFVQPTGELTKQLGGWCFGPTGCKSQGQSQRCISWSLDPVRCNVKLTPR